MLPLHPRKLQRAGHAVASLVAAHLPLASHAQHLIDANQWQGQISVRRQAQPRHVFKGIIRPGEQCTVSVCHPPFHASASAAMVGTQRKWRGLSKQPAQTLNFGGQANELVYPGGEAAFLQTMIDESRH